MAREDFPNMQEQTIHLHGLKVMGTHGVLPEEHAQPQEFRVDVSMQVCAEQAIHTDSVADTISYKDVADAVVEIVAGEHVDLIETLAHRIAQRVVAMGARFVTVTLHKPKAPIGYEFGDVSVTESLPGVLMKPERRRVVLGIGSNLDVPEAHVIEAVGALAELIEIEEVSELYRTAPQLSEGQTDQPDYVNAVLTCYIELPLLPFLRMLHHVEADHGRVRTKRWEARTLDLDVIDVEGVESRDPELFVPHPRAAQRRFVVEPWLSIDPTATLRGEPLATVLARLGEQRVERMDPEEYMPRVLEAFAQWDDAGEFSDLEDEFEADFGGSSLPQNSSEFSEFGEFKRFPWDAYFDSEDEQDHE